jgi:hypothetical protein
VVPDAASTGAGRGDWLTRTPVTPSSPASSGGPLAVAEADRAGDGRQGAPAVPAAEARDDERDRDLAEEQPAVAGLHQTGPRPDDAPAQQGAGGGDRQQQAAGEGGEPGERRRGDDLATGEGAQ